ncbi:nucleotidyltransferase domain-containing protein [bacterium]|nr:nucleotidyltransferase domain-containing protein [bacterium]
MNEAATLFPQIREQVLRDPAYPVHQIADQLLPYLKVIVEQFRPQRVILFGSYAYGDPTPNSDVDLLVLKEIHETSIAEATRIRRALRPLRHSVANLPLDLMVRDPEDFRQQVEKGGGFHTEIARRGIVLV